MTAVILAAVLRASSAECVPLPPPYTHLGTATANLPLSGPVKKVLIKHGGHSVGQIRQRFSHAIMFGAYPFTPSTAKNLRLILEKWDVPDELAILTREELRFAAAVNGARLVPHARNLLFDGGVRTHRGLKSLVERLDLRPHQDRQLAHRQLRELLTCGGALGEVTPVATAPERE